MKYKIINTKTNESHICEKVTINGYDYYVSESDIEIGDYFEVNGELFKCLTSKEADDLAVTNCYPKVIATNNPDINLDLPQLVDKVEELAEKHWKSQYLMAMDESIKPYVIQDFKAGYKESQETYPFRIDDMIEFAEWCDTSEEAAHFWRQNRTTPSMDGSHHEINKQNRNKLFELWNQNRTIKIFV